jgi:hypothetical protein
LSFIIFSSHISIIIPNNSVEFSDKHFAYIYLIPRPSYSL